LSQAVRRGTRARSARIAATALAGVLLAAAAVAGDDRAQAWLLAIAMLVAAVWLTAEGWAHVRTPVTACVVLGAALGALVVVPALMIAARPSVLVDGPFELGPGFALHAIGAYAILAGALAALWVVPARLPRVPVPPLRLPARAAAAVPWALVAVVLASAILFLVAVGGPRHYFSNLDDTGNTTAGLTYLIWGVLVAKYGVFHHIAERWRGGRLVWTDWALLLGALALVGALGARLLLIVALLQLALVYAVARWDRLPVRGAVAVVAAVLVTFVGLGELRRWQGLPDQRPFPRYLVDTGLPNLQITYVNQYADSVRLALLVRQIVPEHAGYENGKELLRILLQPIPGGLRPEVGSSPALRAQVTVRGSNNGNALPLPVVGFIQFGIPGTAVFCFILGFVAGFVDRRLALRPPLPEALALVGAATGVAIVFRGTLVNGVAFMIMDVIGFLLVALLLEQRRRTETA
jgi:hypothetical protein